jgi:hypothetical protein
MGCIFFKARDETVAKDGLTRGDAHGASEVHQKGENRHCDSDFVTRYLFLD